MANNPPTSRKVRWIYRSAFIVLGGLLIGTTYWQGRRNKDEQNRIGSEAADRQEKLESDYQGIKTQYDKLDGKLNAIANFSKHPPSSLTPQQVAETIRAMAGAKTPQVTMPSPDPYIGTPNPTVAMWAHQEADSVEQLGKNCTQDEVAAMRRKQKGIPPHVPDAPGPEFVQDQFWNAYSSKHQDAITKLHDSLTYRLGPVATAFQEENYRELLRAAERADANPKQLSWFVCSDVESYAKELREMADKLGP